MTKRYAWTYDTPAWSSDDLSNAACEVLTHKQASVAEIATAIGERFDTHVPNRLVGIALKSLVAEGLAARGSARYTYKRRG